MPNKKCVCENPSVYLDYESALDRAVRFCDDCDGKVETPKHNCSKCGNDCDCGADTTTECVKCFHCFDDIDIEDDEHDTYNDESYFSYPY